MEPARVILNPYAGRGRGERVESRVRRALREAGVPFELALTAGPGDAVVLARQARHDGYRVVVAAGGDGTVSEVVNGLAQATPEGEVVGTLAVLPIGNGNDFATMAGCPRTLDGAARAIAVSRTRRVDLGRIVLDANGQVHRSYFDNNVGAGFEGRVNAESHKIRRLRGLPLYLAAVFRSLRHSRPFQVEVIWESESGEQHRVVKKALTLAIANSARTGGAFYLIPHARLDDGLLDLGIGDALPLWKILIFLPKVIRGTHVTDPAIQIVRCRRARILASDALPVHADGELLTEGARRLEVDLLPGRLEVIVP